MNLVKCSKGHFYDSDKFSACPHCASVNMAGDSVTVALSSGSSDVTMAISPADVSLQESTEPVTSVGNSGIADDPVTQKSSENVITGGTIASAIRSMENGMNTAPDDEGVTISYYNPLMEQMEASVSAEPVVGWLVCTSGKYFGQSFSLKSGRNFVGRSSHMDVCLEGEPSVSRDRHAVIIYEPKGRIFIAQPGDSRELFYLNDQVVLDNEKLKPYDVLSIGKVEMRLIPFCTEKFAWDDLEKKDSKKTSKTE